MKQTVEQDAEYWMETFREGKELALTHFFDRHYKALCYFANRLVLDEGQAQEIISDCFLKLWERHADFKTTQNIKAFLYISCRNACLDYLKHLKRRTASQEVYLSQLEQGHETVLYEVYEIEIFELLEKEIEELPKKCREVFKRVYFEGRKTDEIAEELGITEQTVRNHKTRAIELLKTSFLKKGISSAMTLAFLLFIEGH